jgi:hypothetical protein
MAKATKKIPAAKKAVKKPKVSVPAKAVEKKGSKVGVFGSRSLFSERVRLEIYDFLKKRSYITTIVTSQEPRGVSEVAQRVARDMVLPLELHFINPYRCQGAFHHRAKSIINSADEFLLIHDGVSSGTANELELVKKSKKPFKYIVLERSNDYEYSTQFNIADHWNKKHDSGSNKDVLDFDDVKMGDIV